MKKFDCVLDFILACHKSSDEWFIGLDKIFSWKGCEIFSKFPAHVLMNWGQKVHTPKNRESRKGFVKAQLERRYFYPPPKSPIFSWILATKWLFSKNYIGFVCDVRETKTLANHKLLKTLNIEKYFRNLKKYVMTEIIHFRFFTWKWVMFESFSLWKDKEKSVSFFYRVFFSWN